jgi:hypothetical protein
MRSAQYRSSGPKGGAVGRGWRPAARQEPGAEGPWHGPQGLVQQPLRGSEKLGYTTGWRPGWAGRQGSSHWVGKLPAAAPCQANHIGINGGGEVGRVGVRRVGRWGWGGRAGRNCSGLGSRGHPHASASSAAQQQGRALLGRAGDGASRRGGGWETGRKTGGGNPPCRRLRSWGGGGGWRGEDGVRGWRWLLGGRGGPTMGSTLCPTEANWGAMAAWYAKHAKHLASFVATLSGGGRGAAAQLERLAAHWTIGGRGGGRGLHLHRRGAQGGIIHGPPAAAAAWQWQRRGRQARSEKEGG